jgi:hypothetical protein
MPSFIVYEIISGCLCLHVMILNEYFGTGPLWTWVDIDPLWTWVKNDDWFDPSYASTLTRVKAIETCLESVFATTCVRSVIMGRFILFWWERLGRVVLHQVTWSKKASNKLKIIISPLFETKFESESFTILFHGNPLDSARVCIQTAVTASVVTGNVRMSSR